MGHPSANSSIGPIYTLVARITFRETQKAPTRPSKGRTELLGSGVDAGGGAITIPALSS